MNLSPVELFQAIHTQDSARINFTSGAGKWKQLASVSVGDISAQWAHVAPFMGENGYFSINSFSMPSRSIGPSGLPEASTGKANIQYLNAHIVDVDCGRVGAAGASGQTPEEALFEIQEQCARLGIPAPGIWGVSGRGGYAIWPFQTAVRAWPEKVRFFESAQRALLDIHGASDKKAVNANRVFRVPGTKHSVSGAICRYYGTPGAIARTDPDEIYERLGIKERPRQWFVTQNPGASPNRKAGFLALNRRRADDLAALHTGRGGLEKGMRLYALSAYAASRLNCGDDENEVHLAVVKMAGECRPAYPSDPNDLSHAAVMRHAKEQVAARSRATAAAMVKRLRVAPDEMTRFALQTLNARVLEKSRVAKAARKENEGRPKRTIRRDFVEECRQLNEWASAADIHRAALAQGIRCSVDSIERDLSA